MRVEHGQASNPAMKIADEVVEAIRVEGPKSSIDFKSGETIKWNWGINTSLPRACLEILYAMGEVVIQDRIGTRRYFELAERALPRGVFTAADPNVSTDDYRDWHVLRREGGLGGARRAVGRAGARRREELARVLGERGNLQREADAHEAARATFEEAQRLAPELEDPGVGLGSLALHAGDAAGGERAFREALVRGKSGRTWCGLGLALVAQNRGREAVSSFEASLELEADRLAAVYGLVQAAFQCGELEAAERRVAAFVELHSGNLDMLFTLAGLRYQLGNRSGACEMLERIEVFKPDYPGLAELMEKLQA